MIDRSATVYPQVSAEEWAERYGIVVKEYPCPVCGVPVKPSIPFATKDYRGLMAASHGCEANNCPSTAVPIGKKAEEWRELAELFRNGS